MKLLLVCHSFIQVENKMQILNYGSSPGTNLMLFFPKRTSWNKRKCIREFYLVQFSRSETTIYFKLPWDYSFDTALT